MDKTRKTADTATEYFEEKRERKFSYREIRVIRASYPHTSQKELARLFKVSRSTISDIVHKVTYKHVKS